MGRDVVMLTRNGLDKTRQFPEIVAALGQLSTTLGRNLVLDGEVVALDASGEPGRFQGLQGRMHLGDDDMVSRIASGEPAAFVAFDLLLDGEEPLHDEHWDERRRHLERVMRGA